MTAADSSSIAWIKAKLALHGHQSWVTPFATWGWSHRPAGVRAVVGCHFDPEALREQVDEILRCFQDADEPANWTLGPSSEPADLSKYLRNERRFMGPMFLVGMELDLKTWTPPVGVRPALRLEHLNDGHPLLTWHPKGHRADGLQMLKELRDLELVVPFGCEVNATLASAATLFIHEGIAGIYDVVTKPELRGQGAATGALVAALLFAREMGCHAAALQSHKKAVGLYNRIGFVETGLFKSLYYSRVRLAADRAQR